MPATSPSAADRRRVSTRDETALLAALRSGDPGAFELLVSSHAPLVRRVAADHVPTRALQEEVVQDTWLAVLEGVGRFEERSSLRTWIVAIARNLAITRGVREARVTAVADVHDEPRDDDAGRWGAPPPPSPHDRALAGELRLRLGDAVRALSDRQRRVFVLGDVEGRSADEVCRLLEISPENQRVLLHRARAQLRLALGDH